MYRLFLICLMVGVLATAPLVAQVHPAFERGYDPAKSFPTAELDSVNLFNGNLTFAVPLAEYPVAGGLSYGLRLVYNSNVWDFTERFHQGQFVAAAKVSPGTNAGLGFRLHFGRLLLPNSVDNVTSHYVYEGPDGSRHSFVERLHAGEQVDSGVFYTRDGSYLRLKVVNGTTREVHFPDGTIHTVTRDTVPNPLQGPNLPARIEVHRVTEIKDPHEWGDLTATTQFMNHDPFGRPGRIRPPEGQSHDVVLWYSGIRSKTTVSKRATARMSGGMIVESDVQHTEITDRQGRL